MKFTLRDENALMSERNIDKETTPASCHSEHILVSESNELEEIRDNYNLILRNAIDPILIISGDTFIDCNDATIQILCANKKEDVLSTHPSQLSPEYQPDGQHSFDKANKMIAKALNNGFHRFEWVHRKLTGEHFPVEVSLTRIKKGGKVVLHTLWKDLTNQKTIETSLRQAIAKSEQANKAKSEFLSRVSHELRTPLNGILGFSQLLQLEGEEHFSEDTKSSIDQIVSCGQHLLNLINDLLDLAKIESGNIEISTKSIPIKNLLYDCITTAQNSVKNACNISITRVVKIEDELNVLADPTRLKEVILNLLTNALKYTPSGSVVVTTKRLSNNLLRIRVTDTGIGIPEHLAHRIFEPFSRLGTDKINVEGQGIGLAISKKLIELMSGQIAFESKENVGTSFWIDIPIDNQTDYTGEAIAQHEAHSDLLPETPFNVLYIEDNLPNIALMKKVFSTFPAYQLEVSTNAEEGIEKAICTLPDLILLDINLPGMNGWEALKILQQLPETAETPVIALTASATKEDIEKGLVTGFSAYLTKPFDIQVLIKSIHQAISQH